MSTMPKADDLRRLIGRLDEQALRHFQGAANLCGSRGNYELTPDHLLMRMLDDAGGDLAQIFNTFKVDRSSLRRGVQQALDELPSGHRGRPALSPKLVELFQSADVMTDELGFSQIRVGMLVLAMALNPGHTRVGEFTPELTRIDPDQLRDHFREIVLGAAAAGAAEPAPGAGPSPARGEGAALEQYTVDLTAKAEAGQIDPVFGRDHEIRQMIDIFARRRKNNPILVGEPGTGKTAIVEGLALRIAQGDVPPALRGVRLISLDLGLLQAGAGVRGEFENRLKNVIKEIKGSDKKIITFIDEAHTLIGAGGSAGGGDAANLLKPALARGELRTVAATTWAEYKKYFEKDAALERRFQLVRCEEPGTDDATVMLRGLKEKYERHHKVIVLDEGVCAAVELSKRYISGRFLPDKAVDLLDTSAARVAVGLSSRPGELEDYDRKLGHLDTAILAIQRDEAGGLTPDEKILKEMQASREQLLKDRAALEERWQKELAAVNRVRELRGQLTEYGAGGDGQVIKGTGPEGTGPISEAAGAAGRFEDGACPPAAGRGPAPSSNPGSRRDSETVPVPSVPSETVPVPSDQTALRAQIDQAIAELEEIQGETPLLFPHVDASAVAAVVSDWTGIPVGSMVKDEVKAMLEMEDRLRSRVVGQDHALKIIAQKLRTSRAGLGNPAQPMGVFLCVGPSGVGKTELALAVADLLFGGDNSLTTINMSEFMEKHTVSQLKGSPPGYVGYGEGGVLTEAVRQHPYSVVLLDEVEKAHPDVMNLFYQVFDKGQLADGEGRVINFKNTVLFLTSNLGTDAIQQLCESGQPVGADELKEAVYPHLREHFKPALVARMTVIPFLTLGQEILQKIARMKLAKVGGRLAATHDMTFEVDDAVYAAVAAQCQQVDLGARQVDHLLDQTVLPELSRQLLERMSQETMPKVVRMDVGESGGFTYSFVGTVPISPAEGANLNSSGAAGAG